MLSLTHIQVRRHEPCDKVSREPSYLHRTVRRPVSEILSLSCSPSVSAQKMQHSIIILQNCNHLIIFALPFSRSFFGEICWNRYSWTALNAQWPQSYAVYKYLHGELEGTPKGGKSGVFPVIPSRVISLQIIGESPSDLQLLRHMQACTLPRSSSTWTLAAQRVSFTRKSKQTDCESDQRGRMWKSLLGGRRAEQEG